MAGQLHCLRNVGTWEKRRSILETWHKVVIWELKQRLPQTCMYHSCLDINICFIWSGWDVAIGTWTAWLFTTFSDFKTDFIASERPGSDYQTLRCKLPDSLHLHGFFGSLDSISVWDPQSAHWGIASQHPSSWLCGGSGAMKRFLGADEEVILDMERGDW